MAQLLLIDDDPDTLSGFAAILRIAGYAVTTASSGSQGLGLLAHTPVDLVLSDLRLPDMSGIEILRHLRQQNERIAFVLVTGVASTPDVVTAMRLGASDFLEKPVAEDGLLRSIAAALARTRAAGGTARADVAPDVPQAHAAARWARALVPLIDAPSDPRTLTGWSRVVFASPGAIRNWCRTAGISPRRALVFGRLLRAVLQGRAGRHKPENLLDVVDRRTLAGLLRLAGLQENVEFPRDIDSFLQRQVLVRDPDMLLEVQRALESHRTVVTRRVGGERA